MAASTYTALLLAVISVTAVLPYAHADTSEVQFVVAYLLTFGQGFVITGNVTELGNWTPTDAPLMQLATGSSSYWLLTVSIEEGTYLEFKPVRVVYDTKEAREWYHGSNLNLTVPAASTSGPTSVYIVWNGSDSGSNSDLVITDI